MSNNHFRPRAAQSLVTSARKLAFQALRYSHENKVYITEAFDFAASDKKINQEERSFARLLSVGVVNTIGILDDLINRVLSSPRDIRDDVREALRISTYELFFLKKMPHAAVDQGVELVRYISPRATGLANYVLRRLTELLDSFPFGNPEEDFTVAIYEQGFPYWLGMRLKKDLGKRNALTVMKAANQQAPLFVMVNACRVDTKKTIELLLSRGIKLSPVPLLKGKPDFLTFIFEDRSQASNEVVTRLIKEGALVVSDLSAQTIVSLSLPQEKPNRFLEIGAGRGTKTIMLQTAALARYGRLLCLETVELSHRKNVELTKRAKRAHVPIECQHELNALNLVELRDNYYDAVFIDAPCSGVGTMRRHHEIRWRTMPEDLHHLAEQGLSMLKEASKKVAPGGRLTYATCTCFEEENDKVIKRFLHSPEGECYSVYPLADKGLGFFKTPISEFGSDIHFAAVLIKES